MSSIYPEAASTGAIRQTEGVKSLPRCILLSPVLPLPPSPAMSAQEHMPPPTLKRARPHSTNLSSSSATPTAQPPASSALAAPHTTSRAKRRKPEPVGVEREREKEPESEVKVKVSSAARQTMGETARHLFSGLRYCLSC